MQPQLRRCGFFFVYIAILTSSPVVVLKYLLGFVNHEKKYYCTFHSFCKKKHFFVENLKKKNVERKKCKFQSKTCTFFLNIFDTFFFKFSTKKCFLQNENDSNEYNVIKILEHYIHSSNSHSTGRSEVVPREGGTAYAIPCLHICMHINQNSANPL